MPKRRCRVLQKDVLSVASDCTGLNAAAMALESLNLPFQEEWVSDSDVAVRSVLQRNFAPKALLRSVQEDVPNHLPVDFFSAGYPCQPYSVLGTGDGLESEDGKVLLYVLQRIRLTRPRTFLLENVENFQKFKKAYELVRDVLKALKDLALVCEISWVSGFQHDHVLNLDLQCCRGKEPCALGRTLVANHTTSCRQEF